MPSAHAFQPRISQSLLRWCLNVFKIFCIYLGMGTSRLFTIVHDTEISSTFSMSFWSMDRRCRKAFDAPCQPIVIPLGQMASGSTVSQIESSDFLRVYPSSSSVCSFLCYIAIGILQWAYVCYEYGHFLLRGLQVSVIRKSKFLLRLPKLLICLLFFCLSCYHVLVALKCEKKNMKSWEMGIFTL